MELTNPTVVIILQYENYRIIKLYTLHLYNVICQLKHLNKAAGVKKEKKKKPQNQTSKSIQRGSHFMLLLFLLWPFGVAVEHGFIEA